MTNYFAYAVNMNLNHMRTLCGKHMKVVGPAQALGYELGFNSQGYGTIFDSPAKSMWGVLFELDETALKALDNYEEYPTVYDRKEIFVKNVFGKTVTATVYFQHNPVHNGLPNQEYLMRVIIGAKENNLPKEWIASLESHIVS